MVPQAIGRSVMAADGLVQWSGMGLGDEEYGAAVLMTTTFLDILQAARWLPALDELVLGVWLQQ